MIDLNLLTAEMRASEQALEAACQVAKFPVLIYCGFRSYQEQAILYRQGRNLTAIEAKAWELERKWKRQDLAEVLLSAPPQKSRIIVTWAAPGQSAHNYGKSFDGVPVDAGKLIWGTETPAERAFWLRYGELIESVGLEWAGHWRRAKREFPHAQLKGFDWRELIRG